MFVFLDRTAFSSSFHLYSLFIKNNLPNFIVTMTYYISNNFISYPYIGINPDYNDKPKFKIDKKLWFSILIILLTVLFLVYG